MALLYTMIYVNAGGALILRLLLTALCSVLYNTVERGQGPAIARKTFCMMSSREAGAFIGVRAVRKGASCGQGGARHGHLICP